MVAATVATLSPACAWLNGHAATSSDVETPRNKHRNESDLGSSATMARP